MPSPSDPAGPPGERENAAPGPGVSGGVAPSTIAIGVAAVIAAGAFLVLRKEAPLPPEPPVPLDLPPAVSAPPPPPAATPSPSVAPLPPGAGDAFCNDVIGLYEKEQKRLSCGWAQRQVAFTLCKIPFEQMPACVDEVQASAACLRTLPSTVWSCDATGNLVLLESACKAEMSAFAACVSE